jgi:hypothetical protein
MGRLSRPPRWSSLLAHPHRLFVGVPFLAGAGGYRSCSDNFFDADLVNSTPIVFSRSHVSLPALGGIGPAMIVRELRTETFRHPKDFPSAYGRKPSTRREQIEIVSSLPLLRPCQARQGLNLTALMASTRSWRCCGAGERSANPLRIVNPRATADSPHRASDPPVCNRVQRPVPCMSG